MTLSDFHLSRHQRFVLRALVRVVCPPMVARDRKLTSDTIDNFELALRSIPTPVRVMLLTGLVTFEQSARANLAGRGRPFSKLPYDLAVAHYDSFWHSPISPLRLFARTLKSILGLSCYELPELKETLAYHPDAWIATVAKRRMHKWGDEIAALEKITVAADPLVPVSKLTRRVRHAHKAA